jgi:hypothetical protein
MNEVESRNVESPEMHDFASIMRTGESLGLGPSGSRLNLKPEDVKNGLGQLVLTVVKLLHELLERQAIRRIESGSLTEEQIERLGTTMMKQAQEIDRLRKEFGLEEEDLNLDLGPVGKLF